MGKKDVLKNKINFVALVSVTAANPNGDPVNGNSPRVDYDGYGLMSPECIKRKLRNRMQDLGARIFMQSEDRCDDGCRSLADRAGDTVRGSRDEVFDAVCSKWTDVRTFGQLFALKAAAKLKKGKKAEEAKTETAGAAEDTDSAAPADNEGGVSIGVRGPVSIWAGKSIDRIDIESLQITKSANNETKNKKSADTMGMRYYVNFGLYRIQGSINVQLAEKTGFTEADADLLKKCLATMFENDASSARPEGSMEVYKLYWWEHGCPEGQYPAAKVFRSVKVTRKEGVLAPRSVDDYDITVDRLDGLEPEVVVG